MNTSHLSVFYRISGGIFLVSLVVCTVYLFVIPNFFSGLSTPLYLAAGILLIFSYSLYDVYRNISLAPFLRVGLALAAGVVVAVITLVICLFFIVNVRGS